MESNEQIELPSKLGRLVDSRMTAKCGVRGVQKRVEGLSKKDKGLMDVDNSVVLVGWEGV